MTNDTSKNAMLAHGKIIMHLCEIAANEIESRTRVRERRDGMTQRDGRGHSISTASNQAGTAMFRFLADDNLITRAELRNHWLAIWALERVMNKSP